MKSQYLMQVGLMKKEKIRLKDAFIALYCIIKYSFQINEK